MNRAKRRAEQKNNKNYINKESEIINKLTKEQIELMGHLSAVKANKIADKKFEEFTSNLDRNISAALLLLGFNINQTYSIENLIAELTEEDSIKYLEFKKRYKNEKEFEEMMKQTDKELRKEIENILAKDISKKQAIEDLRFKFPILSKSMIVNAYQKVKEELNNQNEEVEDPEIKKAMDYIFGKEEDIEKLEKNAEKIIENAREIQCKEVNKGENAMANKLKVLSMTVKGENGTYKVCDKGVELQNEGLLMAFESIEQLDNFTNEYREVFKMINA